MKSPVKYALFFAVSAIIIRMIAFFGGYITPQTGQYVIFMHLFFVLLSVFFAIRTAPITGSTDRDQLINELKTGAKAGSVYAVLVSIFVFVYFKLIDTAYFPSKIEQLVAAADPADTEKVRQGAENMFTVGNYTLITLLGLVTVTMVYTLVLVVINRYVLSRLKK